MKSEQQIVPLYSLLQQLSAGSFELSLRANPNPRMQEMAGICCYARTSPTLHPNRLNVYRPLILQRVQGFRCCSGAPDKKKHTPQLLKVAVSGVTELLRLFSFSPSSSKSKLDKVYKEKNEFPVPSIDDVLMILKSDYENAYFVTGVFTSSIYADDCIFEDPTIQFRGKELYERNLKLLVPFFDCPSIGLQNIEKGTSSETNSLLATWKLRTYLKLPWRPLISIDGSTVYDLNEDFQIIRHAESWNVSALEAIGQLFTPSFGKPVGLNYRKMTVEVLNGSTVTKFIEDTEAFDNCVNERFKMLDVNGDGVLSPHELKQGFGRLMALEYESQSEEEINNLYNSIFEKFDQDQNGTIDCNEFRSLIKEIMLGMASSIGSSPVQVALEEDSLLMKAVEHESAIME